MNLIEAVTDNNIDAVKELLNQGIDANMSIDAAKLRPLHFAAQKNNVAIGELLILAGADVQAKTEPDGETPLNIAKLHNHQNFVDLLNAKLGKSV